MSVIDSYLIAMRTLDNIIKENNFLLTIVLKVIYLLISITNFSSIYISIYASMVKDFVVYYHYISTIFSVPAEILNIIFSIPVHCKKLFTNPFEILVKDYLLV